MPGIELLDVLVRIRHQEFRAKDNGLDLTGTKASVLHSVKYKAVVSSQQYTRKNERIRSS